MKTSHQLTPTLLKEWGERGWIPSPEEKESEFVKRVDFLRTLKQSPSSFIPSKVCSRMRSVVSEEEWERVLEELQSKVRCMPKWIIAFYSHWKLRPWHGAISWIYTHDTGIKFPVIQLNPRFTKGQYLGYQWKEVLIHEAVHALRSAYPESRFEEIFAYSLSKKSWRNFIGPLFRYPRQSFFLIASLGFLVGSQVMGHLMMQMEWFILINFLSFVPILYLIFLFFSLIRDLHLFKRALKKITSMVSQKDDAFALAFRLTDAEIELFAREDREKISTYIDSQTCLRWQQMMLQFPLFNASSR